VSIPARSRLHGLAMLCVAKVRRGGHDYYMELVDTGLEAPGEWLSSGGRLLGLTCPVGATGFEAVMAGTDPSSGKVLGGARGRVEVAGFDLTFCAPKSVSVLHALGEDHVAAEVDAGHGTAVKEALAYVEAHALTGRTRPIERAIPSDRVLVTTECELSKVMIPRSLG